MNASPLATPISTAADIVKKSVSERSRVTHV
jgi:hypothetical protein